MLTLSERREAWAQALESGDYVQGTAGMLKQRQEDDTWGYCCLGVACEVFGAEVGLIEEVVRPYAPNPYILFKVDPQSSGTWASMPEPLRKYLGLSDSLGEYGSGALYRDNDGYSVGVKDIPRKSFKEIAEIIRSTPEGLFVE